MNPDNQNLGGYPNQTSPGQQQGYAGLPTAQPTPPVYGPQQYSPMPVNGQGMPGSVPPKNNKKLLIVVVMLALLLALTIVAAVFMNLQKSGNQAGQDITQSYSSPAGLVPGMQAVNVQSGKFKLRANYVTGGEFTREGTFSVKDGQMYFRMVPDADRVNELMKYLYDRQGSKTPFSIADHGVSSHVSYNFAAMLGYHYLYDQNSGEFSGFIPVVEAAKSAAKPDKRYTFTTACDAALADVKKQTDMNTVGLAFEVRNVGVNKKEALVGFATLRTIDKSVMAFFDSCFDLDQPASAGLKQFVDGRRENVTKSPTFTYWQESGVNYLDVSAPAKDTPFGGELHFELKDLSVLPASDSGTGSSYVERRNQFGLAYSLCRIDPVVTRTPSDGYRFLREDPGYVYPSVLDTGYYCTTLDVPPQFSPPSSITLVSATGANIPVVGAPVHGLRGLHDLVYEVEKYNLSNKRYPGPTEFRDMASGNMDTLTAVTQAAFADKTLVYTPQPAECVGTCNDFALSFVAAPNVQVQRTTYKP